MSFSCKYHGWSHIYKACPLCMPTIASSNTINLGAINTITVESLQAELTDLKAQLKTRDEALDVAVKALFYIKDSCQCETDDRDICFYNATIALTKINKLLGRENV